MGLFSFVQNVGRKIGILGDREDEAAKAAAVKAKAAAEAAAAAQEAENHEEMFRQAVSLDIYAAIQSYVAIDDLSVNYDGTIAALSGSASSQADREKAILVAGNTEGVSSVDDQITVSSPEPESTFHTVASGDTLSKISASVYGTPSMYDVIFQANKPMLSHPDKIYPGQVLRIPARDAATYIVQSGDTLGSIAKKLLGESGKYTAIFEANRDKLDDPNRISAGMVLRIP